MNKTPSVQSALKFRQAEPADYLAICQLVTCAEELYKIYPSGRYPLTGRQLAQIASQRTALTVGSINERIIGFANLYRYHPNYSAFIGNVIIDQQYRGQGLGRQLIQHMIDTGFDEHQLQHLNISVFCDNTPALLLYHDLGFIPYAIEQRTDKRNTKMALLHLRLNR